MTDDPNKNDCTILRDIFPEFANQVEHLCLEHDETYKYRRGSRIAADLKWVKEAAKFCWWKAYLVAPFLILGGWVLWYDFDNYFKAKYWKKKFSK